MACKICEKECPPQCIYIVKSDDKKPDYMGKPQFYPKIFDIDISVCMSCQICVEVCPFEAIKMDKDFELSKRERFDLCFCAKSNFPNRTNTITRFIQSKPQRSIKIWRTRQLWLRRRRKLPLRQLQKQQQQRRRQLRGITIARLIRGKRSEIKQRTQEHENNGLVYQHGRRRALFAGLGDSMPDHIRRIWHGASKGIPASSGRIQGENCELFPNSKNE